MVVRVESMRMSLGLTMAQKGVMISHRNVIANVMQIKAYEKPHRDSLIGPLDQSDHIENVLGLLPMSHIYGLIVICHASVYRGDQVIVLPKFEFKTTMEAIQRYKIQTLFLVCQCEACRLQCELTASRCRPSSF